MTVSVSSMQQKAVSLDQLQINKNTKDQSLINQERGNGIEQVSQLQGTSLNASVRLVQNYREMIQEMTSHMDTSGQNAVETIVADATNALKSLRDNLTDDDLKNMLDDGLDAEVTSLETVARIMKYNKALVKAKDTQSLSELVNQAVSKLASNYQDESLLRDAVTALESQEVTIKKNQVDTLLAGYQTYESFKSIDSETAANLLQKLQNTNNAITVDEIYKALHAASIPTTSTGMEDDQLTELVTNYLNKEGLSVDDASIEGAKLLVERQVPISAESIAFVQDPEAYLSGITRLERMTDMAEAMAEGDKPTSIVIDELAFINDEKLIANQSSKLDSGDTSDLLTISQDRMDVINTIISSVGSATEEQTLSAVLLNKHLSLGAFAQSLTKTSQDEVASKASELAQDSSELKAVALESVTFMRQLSEIRLKMTSDVAVRMEQQGIMIDTASIEDVISRLKSEETALSAIRLQAYGDDYPAEKSLALAETIEATQDQLTYLSSNKSDIAYRLMNQVTNVSVGEVINSAESEAIDEQASHIMERLTAMGRAEGSYESSMTEVRSDLGDRIERTFEQIEPMIKSMGLEPTQSNVLAVEILARNQMPIDETSIETIQLIQEKIDLVTEGLTPVVTVKMVQAGINPVDMSVDELGAYIRAYEEETGQSETKSVAEMILQMDKSGDLSTEERSALLGIYRTLDTVVRSKGAATGFMVKQQMDLNVQGLFEAAKYIRKTHQTNPTIEATVDDKFGMLEEVSGREASIRQQVEKGIEASSSTNDTSNAVNEATEKVRVELMNLRLSAFIKALNQGDEKVLLKDGTVEKPLEEVTALLRETVGKAGSRIDADTYLSAINSKPALLKQMVEQQIPLTYSNFNKATMMDQNIYVMLDEVTEMLENMSSDSIRSEAISVLDKAARAVLENASPYSKLVDAIEEVQRMVSNSEEGESQEVYESANSLRQTMNHVQMIQVTEDYYQIPIYVANQITQLNMYVLDQEKITSDSSESTKVLMSFEAGSLGKVQGLMTMTGNQVSLQVQSTYEEDRPILEHYQQTFEAIIASTNLTLSDISFSAFDEKEPVEVGRDDMDRNGEKAVVSNQEGHIDWIV